jgi:hypothetical protein
LPTQYRAASAEAGHKDYLILADINRYLHAGKLNGVKWGNWWYLRSAATRPGLVFYKGKGAAQAANHFQLNAAFRVGHIWLVSPALEVKIAE